MTHSHRKSTSRYLYFRMDVPARHRERVGKTSWQHSLGTTDPQLAKIRRAELSSRYTAEVRRLDGEQQAQVVTSAAAVVDNAIAAMTAEKNNLNAVMIGLLQLLSLYVRSSWGFKDAQDVERDIGIEVITEDDEVMHPSVPVFTGESEKRDFLLRSRMFERPGGTRGLANQEIAKAMLEIEAWEHLEFPLLVITAFSGEHFETGTPRYNAVAKRYLERLAYHEFTHLPENLVRALTPVVDNTLKAVPQLNAGVSATALATRPSGALRAMRMSEALAYWIKRRRPGPSAVREASRAIERFVHIYGDLPVSHVTREHIVDYRDLLADLPPQTELAKVVASGRTLRELIEDHRDRINTWEDNGRQGSEPARLASGSVKKDIGAFSQIFGKIAADVGDEINVARGIEVTGYSKTKKGQKVQRMPFTPSMMQALFDSPLFTGCQGESDYARTKPGNRIYQDELYWTFLFGVMSGPRLEEIGQIALSDVSPVDLARTFGDLQGECTIVRITGSGPDQEVKNNESDRVIVIHQKLIDLGFNDYIAARRKAGKLRLFDLPVDADGKSTKRLSRRLNDYIDRTVTDDPRYVFHSMRHEFTDRAEMSQMPARVANAIKGHANVKVGDNYGLGPSIYVQCHYLEKLHVDFIDWQRLMAAARGSNRLN